MNTRSRRGQFFRSPAAPITFMAILLLASVDSAYSADVSIGVMGASISDEYQYSGKAYAQNWVEQYATQNGGPVDFGPVQDNPAPRGQGFAYNWSQSGATSAEVLSGGQASGLAAQIPIAGIQYVVLMAGGDDFSPTTAAWSGIYNGTWTQDQITAYVNQDVANLGTAINTMPAGTKIVICTLNGFGITPTTQLAFPNAAQRQLVDNAIAQVNAGIMGLAQADHLVVADISSLTSAVFGTEADPLTTVQIGGVTINLTQTTGKNPSTAAFVKDGIHPNTVIQGVMGNVIMQALDTGYNAGIPLFSESQLLAHQGLAYGGSDTLAAEIGPYSNYVISYAVPEPSSLMLLGVAMVGVMASMVAIFGDETRFVRRPSEWNQPGRRSNYHVPAAPR